MVHRDGTIDRAGRAVFFQCWLPDQPLTAVILIAHGAAEHSGRYQGFAERFTGAGYAVVAADFPGHGRSDGTRGFMRRLQDYTDTLRVIHQQVNRDFADAPVILLGHSMGGLVSALYLLDHQAELAACILSGAAIKSELQPPKIQLLIIRLLSALLPKTGVLQLDATGVSRDPVEVQRYLDDPLVYTGKLSARMVAELFRGMSQVQANADRISLPLLVLHGGADSMTSPEGSRFLCAHVRSEIKTLKIYPGLYHETFNEPERELVFSDIQQWCDERLAGLSTSE